MYYVRACVMCLCVLCYNQCYERICDAHTHTHTHTHTSDIKATVIFLLLLIIIIKFCSRSAPKRSRRRSSTNDELETMENNKFLKGIIVLEEFVKELVCVAQAKSNLIHLKKAFHMRFSK